MLLRKTKSQKKQQLKFCIFWQISVNKKGFRVTLMTGIYLTQTIFKKLERFKVGVKIELIIPLINNEYDLLQHYMLY